MKTKLIYLILALSLPAAFSNAQTSTHRGDFPDASRKKPSKQPQVNGSDTILIPARGNDPALTTARFREISVKKVEKFTGYLSIITDSRRSVAEKDSAISQACSLFVNEHAPIEFASTTSKSRDTMGVRRYLTNLMLHRHYVKVEFSISDVAFAFATGIKKGADGNYYGSVEYVQEFKGTASKRRRDYHDLTTKIAHTMSRVVIKIDESGAEKGGWDIFIAKVQVLEVVAM